MPPQYYRIRVKGHLSPEWADWFGWVALEHLPDGQTLLSGWIPDQAALHGILARIHSLNLTLIAVNCLE